MAALWDGWMGLQQLNRGAGPGGDLMAQLWLGAELGTEPFRKGHCGVWFWPSLALDCRSLRGMWKECCFSAFRYPSVGEDDSTILQSLRSPGSRMKRRLCWISVIVLRFLFEGKGYSTWILGFTLKYKLEHSPHSPPCLGGKGGCENCEFRRCSSVWLEEPLVSCGTAYVPLCDYVNRTDFLFCYVVGCWAWEREWESRWHWGTDRMVVLVCFPWLF